MMATTKTMTVGVIRDAYLSRADNVAMAAEPAQDSHKKLPSEPGSTISTDDFPNWNDEVDPV